MKFKKFFAAVLAGAVALSSFSLSASADDVASSTEHKIYKFEAGVIADWSSNISIDKSEFASAAAEQTLVITCEAYTGAAYSQLKLVDGAWGALDGFTGSGGGLEEGVYTIDDPVSVTLTGTAANALKDKGLVLCGYGVTVNTVTLDGTTIFNKDEKTGLDANWAKYSISAAQLESWGVTAENVAGCSVVAKFGAAPEAGVVGVYVNDSLGEPSNTSLAYSNTITATSYTASFSNIEYAWDGDASATTDATDDVIAKGVTIQVNAVNLSEIIFTAPVASDGGDDDGSDADTSYWQIAAYLFGAGWTCDWTNGAVTSDSGVLTLSTTLGDIKRKCAVDGVIGGISLQVWGAPVNQNVSFAILIKDAGGNKVLSKSDTIVVAQGEYGGDCPLGQYCNEICYGPFSFEETDTLYISVAPGTTRPTIDEDDFSAPVVTPSAPSGGGSASFPSSSTSTPDNGDNNNDDKTEIIDPETLPVKFTDDDNETGVEVAAPEDAFDAADEVTFNAEPIAEETDDKDTFTFDFNFTDKDGNEVQPKSAVTVSVPVPTALTGKTVYVYHIENNGTYTEVNCKIVDGKIRFTVSSFSKYVITSEKLSANGEPAAEQPGTTTPGDPNEPNVATGVGGVAVVLGAAAMAAGVMIVSKKRK